MVREKAEAWAWLDAERFDAWRTRQDLHGTPARIKGLTQFPFDCTHFCYSPVFWELSAHQLFNTLAKAGLPRS